MYLYHGCEGGNGDCWSLNRKLDVSVLMIALLVASSFFGSVSVEAEESTVCIVYFMGVGCPTCAKTSPLVLTELPREYGEDYVVVEYEINQHPENALVLSEYDAMYGCGLSIPLVIFGADDFLGGEFPILTNLKSKIDEYISLGGNELPLPDGSSIAYEDMNIENLPGSPRIWGGSEHGPLEAPTVLAVMAAAAVDAINPCAFAVLVILLSGVTASGGRRKALMAGLAFTTAIFVSYILMGLGIFSISMLPGIAYYFYKAVAILALIVGILNIKDYFWEGAMGVLSSVPESWRPKIQKLLDDVTSVPGALVSGLAVSMFLLPCTSGPYVIVLALLAYETTRILAAMLLLLYNLIFVLPMILIVIAVYFGLTTTAKAAHWRHKRLGLLHLIAGAVMLCMGIWMLFFY